MYDFEIVKCLENVSEFIGVFPRDRLPSPPPSSFPFSLIMNTDKASQPGKHWVAVYCTEKTCEYFDSFGLPPLYHELSKLYNNRKLFWSSRCIQHPQSRTCGEFCISFVKSQSKGLTYSQYIKQFSRDLKQNDKIVSRIKEKD